MLCIRLCAEVLSGSVWPIYFSFSRVLWSVLSLKIWFTWRVTWRDESVWQVCVTNERVLVPVLSCRGLCDQFTLHSGVFMTHILLGTPYGVLSCICMCDDSLHSVIWGYVQMLCTLECLVLGRVQQIVRVTCSSSYPSLSQLLVCLRWGCLIPGRGISGLLRGWLFPIPTISLVNFAL